MARSLILVTSAATLSILGMSASAFAADCFVDSVDGSDSNNGSSETTAWKSLSKIASSCTTVKFRRGSEFDIAAGSSNYAVKLSGTQIKVLTNYGDASKPLPKFTKPHQAGSGAVFSSYSQITIDGLSLSGSRSDAQMSNLADGICIMIGGGTAAQPSVVKNCEISLCDIGMMTSGDYVEVANNYVHDLSISVDAPPGVDPNAVGGAEGIFVNSSHVRVHHNRFINCSTAAQWVTNTNGGGVRCDGGATEVTVPNGKNGAAGQITDVEIDHNFSFNSCGFFEVSSMFQQGSTTYVKGEFTNSIFHDNVMVDSGWISLLQINNTRLKNVTWANNTIVHHDRGSTTDAAGTKIDLNDFGSSSIQVIAFNSTSSGATGGGEISPGDIFWKNNIWYFDPKVKPYSPHSAATTSSDQFIKNIQVTGDKIFTTDPGFIDITSTTDPTAYDLKSTAAEVIDQGTDIAEITSDFRDRPRPAGAAFDLGAFEFQPSAGGATAAGNIGGATASPSTGGAATSTGGVPNAGGVPSNGGSKATAGGKSSTASGGTSTKNVGGNTAASPGGSANNAGSANAAAGGKNGSVSPSGGQVTATAAGNSPSTSPSGQVTTGGGSAQSSTIAGSPAPNGGQSNSAAPASTDTVAQGGSAANAPVGGAANAPVGGAEGTAVPADETGCRCSVPGHTSNRTIGVGLFALAALLFGRSRRRRN